MQHYSPHCRCQQYSNYGSCSHGGDLYIATRSAFSTRPEGLPPIASIPALSSPAFIIAASLLVSTAGDLPSPEDGEEEEEAAAAAAGASEAEAAAAAAEEEEEVEEGEEVEEDCSALGAADFNVSAEPAAEAGAEAEYGGGENGGGGLDPFGTPALKSPVAMRGQLFVSVPLFCICLV